MSNTIFFTRDGRLDAESESSVDAMLTRLAAADDPRLLLFVHGGLVPENYGVGTAISLANKLGPLVDEGWEIGCPVWRSSIGETLRANQDELAKETRFVRIILRIVAWVDRRLGGGALDKALIDNGDIEGVLTQIEARSWPDIPEIQSILAENSDLERAENVEGLTHLHLQETELFQEFMADQEFIELIEAGIPLMDVGVRNRVAAARALAPPSGANKLAGAFPAAWTVAIMAVRIGYRVVRRILKKRDHGVGPTIVEEVIGALYLNQAGAAIWRFMKGDAREHFSPGGAGTKILDGLADIARGGKPVRLLGIGHSAGSLFLGQLAMQAAKAPDNLRVEHLMLAPAIRLDEAARCFSRGRVDGLRIFTMSDKLERANHLDDTVFGKLFHRSLLYLILGVLEQDGGRPYSDASLLGLERHLSPQYRPTREEQDQLMVLRTVFGASPDRLIYSETPAGAAPGRRTASKVHGGYWDDEATLDSIRWIARNGFVQ